MIRNIFRSWPAVVAVGLLQTAVLGHMVWDRASLLMSGRQIELDIVPVDPRSLFRGDYVRLSYDISRISGIPSPQDAGQRDVVYVTLKPEGGDGGKWKPVRVAGGLGPAEPDEIVLKGRLQSWSWPRSIRPINSAHYDVRYGIESFFLPEGTGLVLENMVREKRLKAVIAVDARGNAAIRGIKADGQLIHEVSAL